MVPEWWHFFLGGWGTTFTAYLGVQTLAAIALKGKGRIVCLIPTIPMAIVLGLTIARYVRESNLWPILLIFASPFAIIFVGLAWAVYWPRGKGEAA